MKTQKTFRRRHKGRLTRKRTKMRKIHSRKIIRKQRRKKGGGETFTERQRIIRNKKNSDEYNVVVAALNKTTTANEANDDEKESKRTAAITALKNLKGNGNTIAGEWLAASENHPGDHPGSHPPAYKHYGSRPPGEGIEEGKALGDYNGAGKPTHNSDGTAVSQGSGRGHAIWGD